MATVLEGYERLKHYRPTNAQVIARWADAGYGRWCELVHRTSGDDRGYTVHWWDGRSIDSADEYELGSDGAAIEWALEYVGPAMPQRVPHV